MKTWIIKAFTSSDKKHCFSSVTLRAGTRKTAREKAINMCAYERGVKMWQGGAGHTLTVSPLSSINS